jgi:hypothetical protein
MATIKSVIESEPFGGVLNKSNLPAALRPSESSGFSGATISDSVSSADAKLERIAAALEDIAGSLKIAFPS